MKQLLLLMTLLSLIPAVAGAQSLPPVFSLGQSAPTGFVWPVQCTPDKDCWIMAYPDYLNGDGLAQDQQCGNRTNDKNTGTDIAVRDIAALRLGVDILAAKEGRVVRIRDGEPDRKATPEQLAQTKEDKKECGNAVLIDHGNKTQTLYCHLRNQSLLVKEGDTVTAGQKIAQMGLSGYTNFPHVHFSIYQDGKVIDPFTGQALDQPCGQKGAALWDKKLSLPYQPLIIYDAGFGDDVPTLDALDTGTRGKSALPQNAPSLVFWINIFGANKNDVINLSITAPDGSPFAMRSVIQPEDKTRQLYYVGKTNETMLAPGKYTASAIITRGDQRLQETAQIIVE